MRRSALLAIAVLILTGCGHGPSAHDLAAQACDLASPNNTPLGPSEGSANFTLAELHGDLDQFRSAADLAAEAAAKDERYGTLAEDLSKMEGIFGAATVFYDRNGLAVESWPADERAKARSLVAGWDEPEGGAYAQCRIVKAG